METKFSKQLLAIAVISIIYPVAKADEVKIMNGEVTMFNSYNNNQRCTFAIDREQGPTEVNHEGICNFLLKAKQGSAKVSVNVKITTHIFSANEYEYSVNFYGRHATWPGSKLGSYNYMLEGYVEDVYLPYND